MSWTEPLCLVALLWAQHCSAANSPCEPDPMARGIEQRSLCPYTRHYLVNPYRVPDKMPYVRCRCAGSACGGGAAGARCVEVTQVFRVAYRESSADGAAIARFGDMLLPVSCVCATDTVRRIRPSKSLLHHVPRAM